MTFDRHQPYNDLPLLPPSADLETKKILKQTILSRSALSELKQKGRELPNQSVLIDSLILLEAKDSSEIERIFTTHDDLYQADARDASHVNPHTKEVVRYRRALSTGIKSLKKRPICTNTFLEVVQIIKQNASGIRTGPGTKVSNGLGEHVYTPPIGEDRLRGLLKNLEEYIHLNDGVDPLIKMAVMHYQFEAIHPFSDGNGRTGRILNILFLCEQGLLNTPVLFLSRYIINNSSNYYRGLQNVTELSAWEDWVMYMLQAVEQTAKSTLDRIDEIMNSMEKFADTYKQKLPKSYSKELVELLYESPFSRISQVAERLTCSRQTASRYLKNLEEIGLLDGFKDGTEKIYANHGFYRILKKEF